jgi:predicted O-methyltransferase YrrM
MSAESEPVTLAHFRYLAERTRGDDAHLVALKEAAAKAGIPRIWICPEQASLMRVLLRLLGARTVVEVGTLAGYSAIAMARGLPADGKVVTLELDAKHAAFARDWIARSDVAERIEVRQGDARALLPQIADRSADAMFLDADKDGYAAYLEQAKRILRPGGLLMADNAFAFGQLFAKDPEDHEVEAIRRFNDLMASDARVDGVIVPIGDGLWVARVGYHDPR